MFDRRFGPPAGLLAGLLPACAGLFPAPALAESTDAVWPVTMTVGTEDEVRYCDIGHLGVGDDITNLTPDHSLDSHLRCFEHDEEPSSVLTMEIVAPVWHGGEPFEVEFRFSEDVEIARRADRVNQVFRIRKASEEDHDPGRLASGEPSGLRPVEEPGSLENPGSRDLSHRKGTLVRHAGGVLTISVSPEGGAEDQRTRGGERPSVCTLDGGAPTDATVTVSVSSGTASEGEDFTPVSTVILTIPAGETSGMAGTMLALARLLNSGNGGVSTVTVSHPPKPDCAAGTLTPTPRAPR